MEELNTSILGYYTIYMDGTFVPTFRQSALNPDVDSSL